MFKHTVAVVIRKSSMGCYTSRGINDAQLREAEERVKAVETRLGFRAVTAQEVYLLLANYRPASFISRRVMERFLGKLGFSDAESILQFGPSHTLFDSLREGKGYSIKKLTLLAVFLTSDTDYTKALILFTTYHTSPEPCMSLEEITELICDALHLALNLLVHYAENEAGVRQDGEAQRKLSHYAEVLANGDELVLAKIQRHLKAAKELTEVEFLHRLTNMPGMLLCSACGLREYAYKFSSAKRWKPEDQNVHSMLSKDMKLD